METQSWLSRDGLVPLEHITCSFCHDIYTSPRLLLCLHTFCLDCVQKHAVIERGKYVITCPTCDHKTYSDDDAFSASVPMNSYVQRLKNVYMLQTELHQTCHVCQLRNMKTEAANLCLDCNDNLCESCSGGHNSSTATVLHRVVSLKDVQQGLYMKELIQAQKHVCTEHKGQCSLFCQTCNLLICTLCILPKHKDHALQIPEAAFDKKYEALKESMSQNSEDVLKRLHTAETGLSELDVSEDEFERDLLSKVDTIIDTIYKERDVILDKGKLIFEEERTRRQDSLDTTRRDYHHQEGLTKLWLQLSSCDTHGLLELAGTLEHILQLLNKDNDTIQPENRIPFQLDVKVQVADSILTLSEVRASSQEQTDEIQGQAEAEKHVTGPVLLGEAAPPTDVRAEKAGHAASSNSKSGSQEQSLHSGSEQQSEKSYANAGSKVIPEEQGKITTISLTTTTAAATITTTASAAATTTTTSSAAAATTTSKKAASVPIVTTSSCLPPGISSLKEPSSPLKKTSLILKHTFSTTLRSESLRSDITCLAVPSKGVCLVLDNANQKLKVHKVNGEQMYLVNIPDKCSMFQQFTALDEYGSIIAAIVKNYLLILTRHLMLVKKVRLTAITTMEGDPIVSNFGDNLIVGNLPENEMIVYSESGKFLRKWSSTAMGKIVSIKYAGGDQIVVCSWPKKGHVTVESEKDGNILTIRGDPYNEVPWQPSDACVDARKRIIVSDMRRNEICVFSAKGLLLTVTQECRVPDPSSIGVDETGNIFIAFKGGKIAIFNIK